MTLSERRKYGTDYMRLNKRYEDVYFPQIHSALKTKVSSLITAVQNGGIAAGKKYLSENLTNKELSDTVRNLYKEVGGRHARHTYRFIKSSTQKSIRPANMEVKGFGFNDQWIAFILNYLNQFLIEKITYDVDSTTRDQLDKVFQQAITEGWGVEETISHLRELPFIKYQAARIARTEINRAANVGTNAAVDTSEWQMNKEWISAHDSRVRGLRSKDNADHIDLDGVLIDFEEKFRDIRSGDLLDFPGDPKGSAATTVNCRCTFAPIAKRDVNGRLVPRSQAGATIMRITRPPIAANPGRFLRR